MRVEYTTEELLIAIRDTESLDELQQLVSAPRSNTNNQNIVQPTKRIYYLTLLLVFVICALISGLFWWFFIIPKMLPHSF